MENIENNDVLKDIETGVETPKIPEVDYKALYEKLQKDNANLDRYSKDLKAKVQAKMTEDEQRKAQDEEREKYYKNLELELSKTKIKSKLSKEVGDEKLLDQLTEKFANGDLSALDDFIGYQAKTKENLSKQIKEELLKSNPTPPPQNQNSGISQQEFNKMTFAQKSELKAKDPELYNKLAKFY